MRKLAIAALILGVLATTTSVWAQAAADLYKSKCQMCHGPNGDGKTPAGQKMGAHDFKSPDVIKMTDKELTDVTEKGKNKMPGFKGKITDAQTKELVIYIRQLQKK